MFRILIADDEKFIRKGIISILEKSFAEKVSCVEATNGIEALDLVHAESFNLIITDISMPGCDGLEFVRRLKEDGLNTTVIILSGYENFEYAKRAIQLGVKEYIMKPIKKSEFVDLIAEYISNIEEAQRKNQEEVLQRIEQNRVMEQLKYDFLSGLLKCRSDEDARRYLVRLKELGMSFESKLYTCALVQYEVNSSNFDYMDFAAKNILDEFLSLKSEDEFAVTVPYDTGKIVVIFEGNNQETLKEPKKKLIRKAVGLIKTYCGVRVFAGIGPIAYDSVHLHDSVQGAFKATRYKLFEPADIVCSYNEIPKLPQAAPLKLAKLLKPAAAVNTFELLDGLQNLFNKGRSESVLNALEQEYNQILQTIRVQLSPAQAEEWEHLVRPFSDCFTIQTVKQEVKDCISLLKESEGDNTVGNAALMKQILKFVDDNLTRDLDLNLIADTFNRTPGYISTLFKRHVEGGFNSYLTSERMAIAKKLLTDSNIPIQEVGELCGYNNAKYFSVVFKKSTGYTPREYREHYIV